ncbi:uncharacterized protein MYCFIDRAFT_174003 [Pseudocercospora fijiensis CIRAD86]|uniref:Uncharacterized protein n=1 Tax=Pseudocercospora fijiensis (strain CIRAD86) TaxID=383855 RepID=M3B761_PSEFD|nr:uncharacterized protein MYCFIDRAFT_174003 [Pseudocercospora fijiensis CIRAD86]EME85157.1 hypothetical protein MYCFIDRAFT_174003 [Pseudocercospora fijiensis CIRAD86]
MGNAGSKVCETEKFEQHQQSFARASETFSQKRPHSPGFDLIQDAQPTPKRNRPNDDRIEEVRRDLVRRFEALRPQASAQAAQSIEIQKRAVRVGSGEAGFTSEEEQPSSPSSGATFGHSELADVAAEQPKNSTPCVAYSRSPSPELLAPQVDDGFGYGWSTRHTNADLAELSKILLLTNDWPDYATAFRKSAQQEDDSDTFANNEQLTRNGLGIKLAISALSQIDLKSDITGSGSAESKALENTALKPDDASLQLPNSSGVDQAFDELDTARHKGDTVKAKVLAAPNHLTSSDRQIALTGVWQRYDGSQSPPFPRSQQNWSPNNHHSWKSTWESLRSER